MTAARIEQDSNGRFAIRGDLNAVSVPDLWDECCSRFDGCDELEIDLSGVERSDSAGLALLVGFLRNARETGKTVRFLNIPAQMLAMARVSSLDQILPLQRD
jgi:phospholipid transport system transporter-binding protein